MSILHLVAIFLLPQVVGSGAGLSSEYLSRAWEQARLVRDEAQRSELASDIIVLARERNDAPLLNRMLDGGAELSGDVQFELDAAVAEQLARGRKPAEAKAHLQRAIARGNIAGPRIPIAVAWARIGRQDEALAVLSSVSDEMQYSSLWQELVVEYALAKYENALSQLMKEYRDKQPGVRRSDMFDAMYSKPQPLRGRIAEAILPWEHGRAGLCEALHCIIEGLVVEQGDVTELERRYKELTSMAEEGFWLQRRVILDTRLPLPVRTTCFDRLRAKYESEENSYRKAIRAFSLLDSIEALQGIPQAIHDCKEIAANAPANELPFVLLEATLTVPRFTSIFLEEYQRHLLTDSSRSFLKQFGGKPLSPDAAQELYEREVFVMFLRLFRLNREGEFATSQEIEGSLSVYRDMLIDTRTARAELIEQTLAAGWQLPGFLEAEATAELVVRLFEQGNFELAGRVFEVLVTWLSSDPLRPISASRESGLPPEDWVGDPGLWGPFYRGGLLVTDPGKVLERLIGRMPASVPSARLAEFVEQLRPHSMTSRGLLGIARRDALSVRK